MRFRGSRPANDERIQLNDVSPDVPSETEFLTVGEKPKELATVRDKLVTLVFVVAPFLGLVAAIIMMWGRGFSMMYLILMAAMYVVTALGITVGYHRLFTHRSFETSRFVKAMFAIMGSMAIEGPMLRWVANHRRHHQHSDLELDPHSPHHHGEGLWGLIAGFYHAHVGWIFDTEPADLSRYVGDLVRDRWLRVISGTWFVLGAGWPGCSRSPWRIDLPFVDRCVARLPMGRFGSRVLRASCHLERELGLPPVGQPALQQSCI